MTAPDFWSNRERAQADVEEVSRLRSVINPFHELEREIEDFDALQQLAAEENDPVARERAEKEVATEHARLPSALAPWDVRWRCSRGWQDAAGRDLPTDNPFQHSPSPRITVWLVGVWR